MKKLLPLSFLAAIVSVTVSGPGHAGCDRDVKDSNLQVAEPMTERAILALIEQAKQMDNVEQASVRK